MASRSLVLNLKLLFCLVAVTNNLFTICNARQLKKNTTVVQEGTGDKNSGKNQVVSSENQPKKAEEVNDLPPFPFPFPFSPSIPIPGLPFPPFPPTVPIPGFPFPPFPPTVPIPGFPFPPFPPMNNIPGVPSLVSPPPPV